MVNWEWQLRMMKLLVNLPLRLADHMLPDAPANPKYPQTLMLQRAYAKMMYAYRLDCRQDTFGAVPDGNFERLLRVSMKLLANVSEQDRYYRAWLGLTFILAKQELEALPKNPELLKFWIKIQWLMNLDPIPDSHIQEFKSEFAEIALCDYLSNLADGELQKQN